jgi:KaiC/GvpD/RAD55 family RecA-like ATPase
VKVDEAASLPAVITEVTAVSVLKEREEFDALFARIEAENEGIVPDLTTAAGRAEIKSRAFKITKTKTAIDDARKKLTEAARKQVDAVNAAGRVIWDELETLAAEVRKPLTDWEQAEKDRVAACEQVMADLRTAAVVTLEDTSATVAERFARIEATDIDEAIFQDLTDNARANRAVTLQTLTAALERLRKGEEEAAELARLREREAERQQAEAARLEQEAAAQKERDAQAEHEAQVERDRLAEQERIQRAADDAAQAERDRAAQEQAQRDADHQAQLAAEKRRADEAEAAEAKRLADAKAQEEEDARRAQNLAHRKRIMGQAGADLMKHAGVTEEQARTIVLAITGGNIRHTSIGF